MDPKWIIDDSTEIQSQAIGGIGHGFVQRDINVQPAYGDSPSLLKTYSVDDWPELLAEQEAKQSSLYHIRNRKGPNGGPIPYLNQGRFPYCWKHSAAHAFMLSRAVQNQPYVAISAFSICPNVRSGGWAALAFDYGMKFGYAPQSVVPQGQDCVATPSILEASKPFMVSEGWWDAGVHPGLRKLSIEQVFTLLIDCVPTPVEFNWWGHSVLGLRFVDTKKTADKRDIYNRYALDILNSWLNYGENGVGRITGTRMRPDSSVALTSVSAA